jgi:hypothetical protein
MKMNSDKPKWLPIAALRLSFAGSGLAGPIEKIDRFGDLVHLLHTLPEQSRDLLTNLKALTERMDPICSECR